MSAKAAAETRALINKLRDVQSKVSVAVHAGAMLRHCAMLRGSCVGIHS